MTPGPESALAFAADDGFARGLAVALYSALSTLDEACRPQVYVLDNGLSEASRDRLRQIARLLGREGDLRWVHVSPDQLAGVQMSRHLPAASFSRLLIPELVDPDTRRVVYLDSDVVVRKDLSPLFRLELGDACIAAARDVVLRSFDPESLAYSPDEHRLPRPYHNAGVLVIDVPRWRESGLGKQALEQATARYLQWADQDALNVVVERWETLDDRWNVQTGNIGLAKRRLVTDRAGYLRERSLYSTAAVVHIVGPAGKPWEPDCEKLGTTKWAWAFARSGWYPGVRGLAWFAGWWSRRIVAWPGITVRRWRARLDAARRSVLAMTSSASCTPLGPLRPFRNIRGHALLAGALPPSPIVLDLGANHGDFSRQMSEQFGATCRLVEANPDLSTKLMSEFEVDNFAVAGERGTVHLNIAANDEGSSILQLPDASPYDCIKVGGVDVPACTLEDALERWGSAPIDIVKMDIEGAEVAVLDSTSESALRRISQIAVEFHSAPEFGFGLTREVEEVLGRMQRMGFLWLDFSGGRRDNVLFLNRRSLGIGRLRALFLRAWCAVYGWTAPTVVRAREGTADGDNAGPRSRST